MEKESFFKRFGNWLRMGFHGLFYGMKSTEDDLRSQSGEIGAGSSIIKEVHENRVSKALLKGEITQEVVDLRYRTYMIDREAKKFEFFSPLLAQKHSEGYYKQVEYENSDNHDIILIQPNHLLQESIDESLNRLDTKEPVRTEFLLNIERNFLSRYRLEEYTRRLVVKKGDDDTSAILDFYVSMYRNNKDFKSGGFVKEVKRIKEEGIRSDVLDFRKVSFVTSHAWNCQDMFSFAFVEPKFICVTEFDGSYVLRFSARIKDGGTDLTKEYYSERMDKKYRDNEPRPMNVKIGLSEEESAFKRKYICECCGKEIVYDPNEIDALEPEIPTDDEDFSSSSNVMEYGDAEIAEITFGKVLCKECLAKHINSLQPIKYE